MVSQSLVADGSAQSARSSDAPSTTQTPLKRG
uniref:Uncharacterized protein n=1 Tax=Siphoviridae sp. ctDyb2 TaxID=2826201 RepID=A0A8S5MCB3_9CAUD|nr:MAG TPA: hypothetical protein [Siphoviridae sp. ctDyb2]